MLDEFCHPPPPPEPVERFSGHLPTVGSRAGIYTRAARPPPGPGAAPGGDPTIEKQVPDILRYRLYKTGTGYSRGRNNTLLAESLCTCPRLLSERSHSSLFRPGASVSSSTNAPASGPSPASPKASPAPEAATEAATEAAPEAEAMAAVREADANASAPSSKLPSALPDFLEASPGTCSMASASAVGSAWFAALASAAASMPPSSATRRFLTMCSTTRRKKRKPSAMSALSVQPRRCSRPNAALPELALLVTPFCSCRVSLMVFVCPSSDCSVVSPRCSSEVISCRVRRSELVTSCAFCVAARSDSLLETAPPPAPPSAGEGVPRSSADRSTASCCARPARTCA
eukprot:scaffold20825_cov64-Phaeocystis_antarctica.AAC.6